MFSKNLTKLAKFNRTFSQLLKQEDTKELSKLNSNICKGYKLDCFFELEDNYKRLSRSTKIPYYVLGLFIAIPSTLVLFTPPSHVYANLLSHHYKLSFTTLAWISGTNLGFHLNEFGKYTILGELRGVVPLLIAIVGITNLLFVGDYSLINGFYYLIPSYILMGLYNLLLLYKKLLPKSIFLPSSGLIAFNVITLITSLAHASGVKQDLTNKSHEDFIEEYEREHK